MFERLSRTHIIRNSIVAIVILLLSAVNFTLIVYPNYGFNIIDEQSDSVTMKYYTYVDGTEYHYHTGDGNYRLLMDIQEPGRYNITYHYTDGSTYELNFTIRKWSQNETYDWYSGFRSDNRSYAWVVDLSNETSNGYSFIKEGRKFTMPDCRVKELEKIEVNGDVGYFTTSWKHVELDTEKLF